MKLRSFAAVLLLASAPAYADAPFTAIHPEASIPEPDSRVDSGPYSELIIQVQERLKTLGFDAGPPNGDFGTKTQAALAQFQLSVPLPASGALDDQTLAALGVERPS
jgi:peptidoglycan hydrolase-like protein with peptidoglycan-binding domain